MAEKNQKKTAGKSETENSKKSKKSAAADTLKAQDKSKAKETNKTAEKKTKSAGKTKKSGKTEVPETKAPKASKAKNAEKANSNKSNTTTKKSKAKSETIQTEDYIVIKSVDNIKSIEKSPAKPIDNPPADKPAKSSKKKAEKPAPKEDYIVIKSIDKPAKSVSEVEDITLPKMEEISPNKEHTPQSQGNAKSAQKQNKQNQKANSKQNKQSQKKQNQNNPAQNNPAQNKQSKSSKKKNKDADNKKNANKQREEARTPDLLELLELPKLPDFNKFPELPKLPELHKLPELSKPLELPRPAEFHKLPEFRKMPELPGKYDVKLIGKGEDSYIAMLPSDASPKDKQSKEQDAKAEPAEKSDNKPNADKSNDKSSKDKQKQAKSSKKDKKQEGKKGSDKGKKAVLFSFVNLAPKSQNQVSLNKVKQVFGDADESPASEVAKQENPDFLPRNFYGRYNFIDMRELSLFYQKRVIVNPVFSYAPEVSINKYKEQESDKPAPAAEVDEANYTLTLDNPLLKVEFHSKNKKFVFATQAGEEAAQEATKEAKPKKSKKKNKYEEEALALKNEVIVLPPEDYIKYTFPELEEEREKNKEKAQREIRFTHINPEHKLIFSENMNAEIRATLEKVMQGMDEEFSAPEGARILLAVSGGVDSIALLDIFAQIAEMKKYNISVAHFNHNLRGASSDRDEAAVKQICDKYGIKCYVGSENIMKYAAENSVSIEQAARINRYKMFERLAGNLKLDFVATAHTADDSVETFFLNLFRGSGLTGLSGIPHKRLLVKTTYMIRPLIELSKEDLIHYAQLRQLPWNEDESNSLTHYTRNKIRLELLPQIMREYSPAIFDIINRTSRLIRGADEFISDYVQNAVESLIRDRRKDRFYISIPQLQTYSEYIQGELIQGLLSFVFKTLPFGVKTIDRILSICESPVGSTFNVNKQIYVIKDRNKLIFAQRNGADTVNMNIDKISETELPLGKLVISKIQRNKVEYTRDPNIEFVDADLLPLSLNVRNWQSGDVFKPLGMEGTMKVSDFLTNQKVSIIDKQTVVVLSTKSEIIWVVGRRLSNDYKVNPLTRNVLKLEFIPSKK